MKRFLIAFLAAVMLLGVFSSCGNGNKNKDETSETAGGAETDPVENSRLQELGTKNFSGTEFKILDANDYPSMHINYATEETQYASSINEELYGRDMYLIECFQLADIVYTPADNAKAGCDTLRTQITAGTVEYDMVISTAVGSNDSTGSTLAALAVQSMLCDINSMDYLSLDKEWWSPLVYQNLLLNDRLFFTTGDIAPSVYQAPSAFFVNMNLLGSNFPDVDIFDLVDSYQWTFGKLEELTKEQSDDVNEDGVMTANDDFFGVVLQKNKLTLENFVYASGLTLVKKTEEGLKDNYASQLLDDLLTDIANLYPNSFTYGGTGTASERQQYVITKAFMGNKAIFLGHELESAMSHLRSMESDYAIIPYPMKDESQEAYYSLINNWTDCFVAVPARVDESRLDMISFMMEAMAAYSHKNLRPLVYETVLKTQRAKDPDSSRMVDVILDGICIDFATVYDIGGIGSMLQNATFNSSSLPGQRLGNINLINSDIKDIIEAHSK